MYKAQRKFHGSAGNSKIGKMANINLLCGDDNINGRTDVIGSCTGCCDSCKKVCYGRHSYRFTGALQAHADNTKYAREDLNGFFADMKKWLKSKKDTLVRIHPHGEILSKEYLNKMYETAKEMPDKKFYVYTKRYSWVSETADSKPDNLTILLSPPFTCKTYKDVVEWSKKENKKELPLFIYDDRTDPEIGKLKHCPAVNKEGHRTGVTCDKCQRCPKGLTTAVYAH